MGRSEIEHYWPMLSEALDKDPELWSGAYTKDDILAGLFAGNLQIWGVSTNDVVHLVFMTQVYRPPNGVGCLQVWWVYGEGLQDKMPLIDLVLDQFAASVNCGRIEGQGRDGFEKLVRGLGYTKDYTVWSRPVRAARGN